MFDRSILKLELVSRAALRVVLGGMFACHGAQKIFGVLHAHEQPALWTQLWWGGLIELVCGALVALGLLTRPAALLASGTMAVAYFQFDWSVQDGLGIGDLRFLPIVNGGELAVLYCFAFLLYAVSGPGAWSIDQRRHHTKPRFAEDQPNTTT